MAMNWCSSYSSSPSSSSSSFMNSSMESEMDSTESESDKDDDYLAVLTQQVALLMLQENDEDTSADNKLLINPKSILENSLQEIDKSPSSPLLTAAKNDDEKPGGINKSSTRVNEEDSWSRKALIDEQIKNNKQKFAGAAALRQKKMNRQKSERKLIHEARNNIAGKTKTAVVDMKANENGKSLSSMGTGVFLPKGAVYASAPSEKAAGGATVIIPARVANALKLHFDKIGVPNSAVSLIQQDGYSGDVIYGLRLQNDEPSNNQASTNPEKLLPVEWTY